MEDRANLEHESLYTAPKDAEYIERDFWNWFHTTQKQRLQLRELGFVRVRSGVISESWNNSEGIETLIIGKKLGICIKYFVSLAMLKKLTKILTTK